MIYLDDKKSKGTPWVSLFIDGITAVHTLNIPREVLNKIRDNNQNTKSESKSEYRIMNILRVDFIVSLL